MNQDQANQSNEDNFNTNVSKNDTINILESILPASINFYNNEYVIKIHAQDLISGVQTLKENIQIQAKCFIGAFGVHYPQKEDEFEINYLLLSLKYNLRFKIKISLKTEEKIQSICSVFESSIWYEREIYDMYGVVFEKSPDLRRILTDYNFKHYPLRKDFPLTGYAEVIYNPISQNVEYESLELSQEYRNFDFQTPWNVSAVYDKIRKTSK